MKPTEYATQLPGAINPFENISNVSRDESQESFLEKDGIVDFDSDVSYLII